MIKKLLTLMIIIKLSNAFMKKCAHCVLTAAYGYNYWNRKKIVLNAQSRYLSNAKRFLSFRINWPCKWVCGWEDAPFTILIRNTIIKSNIAITWRVQLVAAKTRIYTITTRCLVKCWPVCGERTIKRGNGWSVKCT